MMFAGRIRSGSSTRPLITNRGSTGPKPVTARHEVTAMISCCVTMCRMSKTRLEAFSDGVLAIIITIMVLEFRLPDAEEGHALTFWEVVDHVKPVFLAYVLSFVFVGIYWCNHHHLMHAVERVSGAMLWANLHL